MVYTKYFIMHCPLSDECSHASWGRIKRCQSWNDAAECRSTLKRHLTTSWNHAASKAVSTDDFEELIADVEVLEEEVPDYWFDKVDVTQPTRPTPKPASRPTSKAATMEDRRDEDDARVARIALQVVAAVAEEDDRGSVSRGPKRPRIGDVDDVTGGSSSSTSDLVLVPRNVLKRVLDDLEKTSAALQRATQMFASAQTAFNK